jgi:hypothetical protein
MLFSLHRIAPCPIVLKQPMRVLPKRAANQSGKLRILARQTLVKPRNGVKG